MPRRIHAIRGNKKKHEKRQRRRSLDREVAYTEKRCIHVLDNGEQCDREIETRGLCHKHYVYRHRQVAALETSWPELEREGLSLPSKWKTKRQYSSKGEKARP